MLFMLTNWTLDIVFGVTWWVVSKTSKGIYYILYGRNKKGDIIELANTNNFADKKYIELLLEESKKQKDEIKRLNENITILSDYMKKQTEHTLNNNNL